jgi:FMN phosphatase YigB (HAD superfamily)
MRILSLPERPEALVFDLDSTLYEHPAYAAFQEEVLVERLARERGEELEATRSLIAGIRAERAARGEAKTSLGNIFARLGADIATSVRWREELIRPAEWLRPDPALERALAALAARFPLALVTNNPRLVGERSLEALGVRPQFKVVIGLDDTHRSKPDPAAFRLATERLAELFPGLSPAGCVSIGDRPDIDLLPALEAGYGGAILIERVAEVYGLAESLCRGE